MIDLNAGAIAGGSGIVVGQPLDTIKVRLQTHRECYQGPVDCATQTLRQEGVSGFFKGLTSPLFGSLWTNAIVFCSYGSILRHLEAFNTTTSTTSSTATPLTSIFTAGTIAGLLQSVAVCPTELIKCRLQIQNGHLELAATTTTTTTTTYRGPMDCVRHLYRHNGVRGLFLGWWPTVWREAPSFGVYFVVYEAVKRQCCLLDHLNNPSMSIMLLS